MGHQAGFIRGQFLAVYAHLVPLHFGPAPAVPACLLCPGAAHRYMVRQAFSMRRRIYGTRPASLKARLTREPAFFINLNLFETSEGVFAKKVGLLGY